MDKKFWFATLLERAEMNPDTGLPDYGSKHTIGFSTDFDQMELALNTNALDIQEGCYRFAFLEAYEPGVYPMALERVFYVWDRERRGFFRAEEMECFRHLCNFALG